MDAGFVDHVAPVDVDLVDFIDVICSDDEWLRAEFDAIIASWSSGQIGLRRAARS